MTNKEEKIPEHKNISDYDSIAIKYINIFYNNKKFILISTVSVGLIATFLLFFVIKPVYYSSAIVKSAGKSSGLGGLLTSGSMADIAGLDELSGSGSSVKELALYNQILISRRCLEETIIKFNLMDVYDFRYMQDAVKNFRENILDITKDNKSGTMEIGVYDISPERAKEIASFLITQLNKINIELNVQNAKTNREFIEQRYDLIRRDLVKAEDSLKLYQENNGIAPDVIAKAVLQTEVQTIAELKSEEIKLDILKKILSPDQIEIKVQEEKINSLNKQIDEINNSENRSDLLKLKDSPRKIMDFMRLQRNVEIQNKLLAFILPLYEQAKIEEKKEMPSVLVLDQPVVPEHKKKPKRVLSILISMLIALLFLSISVIVYDTMIKKIIITLKSKKV
ncbi:MAG: GNVR domain-containing protein [Ignavibacteria bacterium]|jgi:capsule polysaccharide export protein KpsE/RkpR